MTVRTILAYLFGHRQAILDVASSRGAVWLGLVFVFSAEGLSRQLELGDRSEPVKELLLTLLEVEESVP